MNIVFWLLVVAALVLLWFFCSWEFKSIGAFWYKLYADAKRELDDSADKVERLAGGESPEEVLGWSDDEKGNGNEEQD